jgi:diguanylate cyclase (GGDEF)-like protein
MLRVRLSNFLNMFRFRKRLAEDGLSDDLVQRIQTSQLDAWVKMTFITVPIGTTVALLLLASFWRHRSDIWLDITIGGIVVVYAALFRFCLGWVRRRQSEQNLRRATYHLLILRFSLGGFWGASLVAMMAVSDSVQQVQTFALSISLISTSVFGGPSLYAFSFWFPVTIGGFGTLFATGSLLAVAPLVCLILYSVLTFLAILSSDRQIMERNLTMARLESHAETISILLRDFEESASDWLWETDAGLTLQHVSARFAEVAKREAKDLVISLFVLLGDTPTGASADRGVAQLRTRVERRLAFREIVVAVLAGGERRWWALTGKPLFTADGSFIGYRGVGSDVTSMHRSRERVAYLARHDALTDLANRTGFNDAIAAAMAACHRQCAALLCLDLDEFKSINDSYGHDVGDSVLRAVAQRIRGVLREHDMAARLGGDEFAVLIASADANQAAAVAERLIEALGPPFACGDLVIRIGVSIGIALAPTDGEDPETLYRNADLALYRAKAAGRGTWRQFDPNMDRQLHERRLLQRDIRDALPRGELFVMYQPVVDLRTRELAGFEALVRWTHPERGLVPPSEFVPIAEQSGLIGAIGLFVLTEAARLASRLPAPLHIAVNLSPLQLRDEHLLSRVATVMEQFALRPDRIEFEVTESVVLETSGRSLENLRGLRNAGHRIAIDDFGTGYSSLSVLRSFPFDRLKIDRSFITDLVEDEGDGSIVKAVIGLSRALGIAVIAEGVESETQATILCDFRCAFGQGYYFARPLSEAQVLGMLPGGDVPDLRGRLLLPGEAAAHEADASERRAKLRLVVPRAVSLS